MAPADAAAGVRAVSVLPSATEMLCFIGGGGRLVGRSHEDNYPAEITHLPVLTGQRTQFTTCADVDKQVSAALSSGQSLYTLDVELLKQLRPDVILTQDICSVCAIDLPTVERVAAQISPSPQVVSLNPMSLNDVLANITQVGEAVGMQEEAAAAIAGLRARLAAVDARVEAWRQRRGPGEGPNVAFVEWPDPIYVGGHWTPELIARAGGRHPLNPTRGEGAGKSFPVPVERFVESDPDLIIICPCGLDLVAARREAGTFQAAPWWPSLRAVQAGRVALVDGDAMFNRPGPRLVDALEWLAATLLDDGVAAPEGFPVAWLDPQRPGDVAPPPPDNSAHLKDIEELHSCAVEHGESTYIDPATGYTVMTQLYMIERGWCCGNGCRHCPYGHVHVDDERRGKIQPPINVPGTGCPHKSAPKPPDDH